MGSPAGQRMRAIVQEEYGTADVLRVAEIERPSIGADEVLVKVRAAGLDRGTWHLMAGMPYAARLVVGLRAPKNPVPGLDTCGGEWQPLSFSPTSPWVRAATFCFHPEACYGAGLDRLTPARSGSAAGPVTWRGHGARVFTVTWRTAA